MSTIVKNGKADKKVAFVNNNPVNKANTQPHPEADKATDENKGQQPNQKTEPVKADATKAETRPQQEQPKTGITEVREEPQAEIKPEPVKSALNLEKLLKLVSELNRRKIQRDKLLETIENLEAFEIELKEDADETDGNIYQVAF